MCTVAELKMYLEKFPEDTEVQILEEISRNYVCYADWKTLSLEDYSSDAYYFDREIGILQLGCK